MTGADGYNRYIFFLFIHHLNQLCMDAFIGEIRPFAFLYAPEGWLLCNGHLVPIRQYEELFSILGFRFGGDRRNTFALPNLQGVALVGAGAGPDMLPSRFGEYGGSPVMPLNTEQIPSHSHTVAALVTTDLAAGPLRGVATPDNTCYLSNTFGVPPTNLKRMGYSYTTNPEPKTYLGAQTVGITGSGKAHNNMQPYLVINYCICAEHGEIPLKP